MSIPKIDSAIIEAYKKLDSTSISDAMDKLGIPAGLYGIKPVTPGVLMCGQAFTVRYVPVSYTHLDVYKRQQAGHGADCLRGSYRVFFSAA